MTDNSYKKLILLTESYPFGAVAESFLDLELPFLSQAFETVIIVPYSRPNDIEKIDRVLPVNVSVNTSLLSQHSLNKPLKFLDCTFTVGKSKYFYKEIFKRPRTFVEISSMKRTISYIYGASRIQNWAIRFIKQENIDITQTIFYTYWMNFATMGIGMAKKIYPKIKLVCRVHGGDLYEERYSPPYLPCRFHSYKNVNRVYPISNHGLTYLIDRYDFLSARCSLSRLGVKPQTTLTRASSDGVFRIVSCSYIVPVKRIHRIILALTVLGQRRNKLKIEWTHIGYGPLLERMIRCASSSLPKNVTYEFLGFLPNPEVISFYRSNPVDVFINVSASEGIPVSIMEAQSCGIPVIASAVGGTPEIVSEDVGHLLSKNPSPVEIADTLEYFIDHPEIIPKKRFNSIKNWDNNYNAIKNFTEFTNNLKKL